MEQYAKRNGNAFVDINSETETKPVIKAGWQHNSIGWWYQNADGTYPTSCWKMIDGKWYAFDARGYMRTSWFYDGGKWYYLGSGGAMQTGWVYDGGSWYYLYSNGKMASNTWIGNYYVNASGAWVQ